MTTPSRVVRRRWVKLTEVECSAPFLEQHRVKHGSRELWHVHALLHTQRAPRRWVHQLDGTADHAVTAALADATDVYDAIEWLERVGHEDVQSVNEVEFALRVCLGIDEHLDRRTRLSRCRF